jgi:hypothetical protein
MRQRYRDLQGLNTHEQLVLARSTVAIDLATDFAESVAAFQKYVNREPFYQTERKALLAVEEIPDITRTEHFAAVMKARTGRHTIAGLNTAITYVERELVPTRTTGEAEYSNGEGARRLIRFDLLLAGELPILSELKLPKDNASAFYALIQLLTAMSEMASQSQRYRLWQHYADRLSAYPRGTRFDLFLIFYRFNCRSKPKMEILNLTDRLARQLLTFKEINSHVRQIVALDSDWPGREDLVFQKLFSHSA